MKRFVILILLALISLAPSFAEDESIELTINSQPVELEHPIIQTESGQFLAPMEEFFTALRIPIDQLPSRHLSVFRDNIFLKFRQDYPLYEVNGREFRWTNVPSMRDGVVYIEINMFLKYMDLAGHFDEKTNRLDIRTSRALDFYRPESTAQKQVPSIRTGLRYLVPSFWNRQEFGYGVNLMGQTVSISFDRLPANETGLEDAITNYMADQASQVSSLDPLPKRSLTLPLFNATIASFQRRLAPTDDPMGYRFSQWGFFELNGQYFVANLESNLNDQPYLIQLFDDILESVESSTLSIDSLSEHYVEFRNYSLFRTFISSPIYSNIRTNGQLNFRGNIDSSVEYLDVIVKKGRRTFEYQIPVTYGAFDEPIPIPFGLGFHQVTILLPEGVESADDFYLEEDSRTLLKLSVINRTLGESLLTSSSKLVHKDHELIQAAIKDIPSQLTNYQKAEKAFALLDQFSASNNDTLDMLLADNTGNSKALAAVYTSYLRAMNVPTRILKTSQGSDYFVEFYSNGKWIFTRPYQYMRNKITMSRYFDVSRPKDIQLDLLDY